MTVDISAIMMSQDEERLLQANVCRYEDKLITDIRDFLS